MKGNFNSIIEHQNVNSVSILSITQKCGIELKQTGTKYSGLCPLHGDKNTPSFFVYPETNTWACFGANCINPNNPRKRNGGNGVEFISQLKHYGYLESVQWIKNNFSLSIRKKEIIKFKRPKQLPKISDDNIAYYHSLLDLARAREWFIVDRGLTSQTIDEQALGYDGENYVIPIWENKPRVSNCLCIKLRRHNNNKGPKYIRFGSYKAYLYNIHSCKNAKTIYMFAGELDALLAHQDGLPACSVINGAKSIYELGDNWPNVYFPKANKLVIIFDRNEEASASIVAKEWDRWKGKFTSHVFQWPYFGGSDYTDYRIKYNYSFQEFRSLL